MASLKNIMNTEDEPVDPRSESRSTDLTSRSSSVQSYVTSLNHQAPSSSHNNPSGPSESSKSPSVLDHSSPTTTELNMNTRRRSNMSIDSNDMSYGSSQHDSSSNTSMRPFTASGSSEPHVRWTPITGKISKAKKGVPVHKCHQCHKTFTRAEHLRRHQLSHSPPDLCCPVPSCNKTFYRKDLLDRHVQKHNQDGSGAKEPILSPGPEGSKPYPLPRTVTPHKPILRPSEEFADSQPLVHRNVPATWSPVAPTPNSNRSYNPAPEADRPGSYMSPINYDLGPTLSVPSGSFATNHPMLPGNATPELQWQDNSATTSEFSTPPENARRPQFSVVEPWTTPVSAYPTSSNDMLSTMNPATYSVSYPYSNSTPPQVYPSVFPDVEVPLPVYNEGPSFGTVNQIPTSTVRSVSPSLAVAQSETLVAVPPLPTPGGTFNLAGCGSGSSGGEGLLSTEDLMPLSLSPAIKEAIPRYLEVYWDKVHPKNPIVHKHTYQDVPQEEIEHVQALQCAMAALATQFIPIADDRMKGAQLHAYAWQQSKVFTHVGKWSMPVQQTIALCEYYARFRGRKSLSHQPSTEFTSLYPRVVRDQYTFTFRSSAGDERQAWKDWVAAESLRRLLAACFLLDVHSSWYHERQYISVIGLDYSSPSTLPIPLTATTTKAWEAEDYQSWSKLRARKDPKAISNTNLGTLSASDIASAPAFDAAVLLAVYSLFLPRRQTLMQVDIVGDATKFRPNTCPILGLFPDSAIANTYLALHHTPLYYLLSVSGKSWVFNKKLADLGLFTEYQKLLDAWRSSDTASTATVFAARALKAFLGLKFSPDETDCNIVEICPKETVPWSDISDYWGIYVCTLICWAYGLGEKQETSDIVLTQEVTKRWISRVACQEPFGAQMQSERKGAQGVASLAREMLANDCLGGGNILFADAVNVLKRLEEDATRRC